MSYNTMNGSTRAHTRHTRDLCMIAETQWLTTTTASNVLPSKHITLRTPKIQYLCAISCYGSYCSVRGMKQLKRFFF